MTWSARFHQRVPGLGCVEGQRPGSYRAPSAFAHPRTPIEWADNGYKSNAVEQTARIGIDLEIVQRDPTTRGFHVQPHHWVVERALGWLMHRRLACDYETTPTTQPQ